MKATYVDHMGSDLSVVNAAKVSFGKRSEWQFKEVTKADAGYRGPEGIEVLYTEKTLSDKDKSLIQFLATGLTSKEREVHIQRGLDCSTPEEMDAFIKDTRRIATHFAPFTKTAIQLHISCPIFVTAQLFKHQVGLETPSSISYRYVEAQEFYNPVWRLQAQDKKQGSGPEFGIFEQGHWTSKYENAIEILSDLYKEMNERGVALEQARMILPQSTMTEFIWQGNVAAWARLYNQRTDSHAQKETQMIAHQIGEIVEPLFPESWRALTQ